MGVPKMSGPARLCGIEVPGVACGRRKTLPWSLTYIAKRTAEGKTPREAQRCLKRYIARQIYRLLQHPKINT